jgi:hypothetical protein
MKTSPGQTKVVKARRARREWLLLQEQTAIGTKKQAEKDSIKLLDELKNDKTAELGPQKEQNHLRVIA